MVMFRLCSLACLLASAFAFQSALPVRLASSKMNTPLALIMSDDETEAILRTIEDCSEHSQCGVDDVSSLLYELKQQEKELQARLESLDKVIVQLKELNHNEQEDRDAVRAFVRDMLRVFHQGGPAFPASGFTGDIGNGPMTAYDALPPKKWKPSRETN